GRPARRAVEASGFPAPGPVYAQAGSRVSAAVSRAARTRTDRAPPAAGSASSSRTEGKAGDSVPIDSIWSYASDLGPAREEDLTGYTVVASDGTIGHVDRRADHHGMRHLVVDTGVWVFGRSLLVPVGVVEGIDSGERRITLACTRAEVKAAPRIRTASETQEPVYLTSVSDYYPSLTGGQGPTCCPVTSTGRSRFSRRRSPGQEDVDVLAAVTGDDTDLVAQRVNQVPADPAPAVTGVEGPRGGLGGTGVVHHHVHPVEGPAQPQLERPRRVLHRVGGQLRHHQEDVVPVLRGRRRGHPGQVEEELL